MARIRRTTYVFIRRRSSPRSHRRRGLCIRARRRSETRARVRTHARECAARHRGLDVSKKKGAKYLQRLLSRQKKEPPGSSGSIGSRPVPRVRQRRQPAVIRMTARSTGEPSENGVGAVPISGILRDRFIGLRRRRARCGCGLHASRNRAPRRLGPPGDRNLSAPRVAGWQSRNWRLRWRGVRQT